MKSLNILDWEFSYMPTAKVKDYRLSPLYTVYFTWAIISKYYDFMVN